MLAIEPHTLHTTVSVCTYTSTDWLIMRAYLARQKETLAAMAFVIKSYQHPNDKAFQLFAEISIEELLADLFAELSVILSAQDSTPTLAGADMALSPCVIMGYGMASERKEWFGMQKLL